MPPDSTTIDDTFDNLLSEVESVNRVLGAGKKQNPAATKTTWPDALVFIQRNIRCACGTTYSTPNTNLLLRFGKTRKAIKNWNPLFNNLPREILETSETAPACSHCIDYKVIEGV